MVPAQQQDGKAWIRRQLQVSGGFLYGRMPGRTTGDVQKTADLGQLTGNAGQATGYRLFPVPDQNGSSTRMTLVRRTRIELARLLDPKKEPRQDRWTSKSTEAGTHIVLRDMNGAERELTLRPNSSDFPTFLQIFEQLQYDTSKLARHRDITDRYRQIVDSGQVPLIVDGGANVGLAALYFRDVYPEARILAIEPEESNFRELADRCDDKIIPIKAGLASFDGHLEIVDPGLGQWGFRTRKSDQGVPALRLQTLLDTHEGVPFILKIDIEGFEADLFDDPALIDRFMVIFFEPHDWMLPKQRSASSFIQAVAGLDRDFLIAGENILSIANH
jgi:FkbM family methyltransferase